MQNICGTIHAAYTGSLFPTLRPYYYEQRLKIVATQLVFPIVFYGKYLAYLADAYLP